ncbi:MAG: stage II sporulation protein R [Clostridia bacterium]|nr:stage II sporulation protein R [Clostridia bacterium]
MRNLCITFLILTIIVLGVVAKTNGNLFQTNTEVLRIHIRADSNQTEDQQVKYKVKDAVVEFLTPKLSDCNTKSKAEETIKSLLSEIETVCDGVLEENGYDYKSKAKINVEEFPTRVYGGLTLENGFYDALIIELGSGSGDNWWCVVYPPLCFTGEGKNYVYRSKLKQIINDFYEKHKEEK